VHRGRYLRRFDPDRFHPTRLLDLDAVPVREIDAADIAPQRLTERDFRRGWYTRTVDDALVGYCATPDGPVLFHGDRGFLLDPDCHSLTFETLGGFPDHVDTPLRIRISLLSGPQVETVFVCRGLVKTCDDWGLEDEPEELFHDLRREMEEPGFRDLMTVPGTGTPSLLPEVRGISLAEPVLERLVRLLKGIALLMVGLALAAVVLWARGWL